MGTDTEREKYPVTETWKARVRGELEARGRGAASKMAHAIGVGTGQLSELLSPASRYSHLVPLVHDYLGWDLPSPPIPGSSETGTIRYLLHRATDEQLRYMLDAANMLTRAPNTEATHALMAMLRAFRSGFDPRRDMSAVVRILMVTSNEVAMRHLEKTVEPVRDRVNLIVTDNPIDAGLLIGAQRPNLVVVDESLGGIELCRKVRANYETAQVAIVITSAKPSKSLDVAARKAGALRVIQTPIDVMQLLDVLSAE